MPGRGTDKPRKEIIAMSKRVALIVLAVLAAGGCVTTPTPVSPGGEDAGSASQPAVTLAQPASTLGEIVRRIGEEVGGGLVLMSGIEGQLIAPLDVSNVAYMTLVQQLADETGCTYHAFPNYAFIYPRGYEALIEVSVAGMLAPAFQKRTAAMTFGYDTPIFKILALLSHSLGATVFADNIVGDARCGAVTIEEVPLADCLEAMLRSARVPPGSLQVESTDQYTFLYGAGNMSPKAPLLNAGDLDAAQRAALDTEVTVILGARATDETHIDIEPGATPLRDVVASLSQQIGMAVTVESGMEDLPVNPCVFNRVSLRVAMDLLIRQWPVPEFGYQLAESQVTIKRRPQ